MGSLRSSGGFLNNWAPGFLHCILLRRGCFRQWPIGCHMRYVPVATAPLSLFLPIRLRHTADGLCIEFPPRTVHWLSSSCASQSQLTAIFIRPSLLIKRYRRLRHSHGGTGWGSAHKPFLASRASFSNPSSIVSPGA